MCVGVGVMCTSLPTCVPEAIRCSLGPVSGAMLKTGGRKDP